MSDIDLNPNQCNYPLVVCSNQQTDSFWMKLLGRTELETSNFTERKEIIKFGSSSLWFRLRKKMWAINEKRCEEWRIRIYCEFKFETYPCKFEREGSFKRLRKEETSSYNYIYVHIYIYVCVCVWERERERERERMCVCERERENGKRKGDTKWERERELDGKGEENITTESGDMALKPFS